MIATLACRERVEPSWITTKREVAVPPKTVRLSLVATLLLVISWFAAAGAEGSAYQVADLAPNTPARSEGGVFYPTYFEPVANGDLFVASAGSGVESIWLTDGTPSGTRPVVAGAALGIGYIVGGNGERSFYAGEMRTGVTAVWVTDGTAAGTTLLKAELRRSRFSNGAHERVIDGRLFFHQCAAYPSDDCELWTSDGTPQGTVKLAALGDLASNLTGSAGAFYFFGSTPEDYRPRFWRTDGTAAGTVALRTFEPSPFLGAAAFAGRCVFVAEQKLWVANGNAVQLLRTLGTNEFIDFYGTQVVGNQLYFWDSSGGGTLTAWRTDGTVGGTSPVLSTHVIYSPSSVGGWVEKLGDRLYYLVPSEEGRDPYSLWSSDAAGHGAQPLSCPGCSGVERGLWRSANRLFFTASAGTVHSLWIVEPNQVPRQVAPYCDTGFCETGAFADVNGRTSFWVSPTLGAFELWATDGTAAGTLRIESFHEADRNLYYSARLDAVLFGASTDPGVFPEAHLWLSRGTAQSTVPLTVVEGAGSDPYELRRAGDRVAFLACGEERGLWGAGAHDAELAKEGYIDCLGSSDGFHPFVSAGPGVFFQHAEFSGYEELWVTEGTASSTRKLLEGNGSIRDIAPAGDHALIWTNRISSGATETRLWRSDGTAAGTTPLLSLPSGAWDASATTDLGGEIYFRANSPLLQIWRTDGTAAGLRQLTNGALGEFVYEPELARVGAFVFFAGASGIWRTNGTTAGTSLVVPLAQADSVSWLHEQGGALLFRRTEHGVPTLWRTQGLPGTTQQVAAVDPTLPLYYLARPAVAPYGGLLYFAADDGSHGVELWRTDGTTTGTVMVRDIGVGPISGNPRDLVVANGRLYFTADDLFTGSELWVSDGTSAGTRLVQDIAPQAASSSPAELTVVGDLLYFSADDGITGRELWALPLTSQPSVCIPSDGRLCLQGGRFQVEVSWRDFAARSGSGHARALTGDTGYFWFFDPANVELTIKVLDGTGLNGHHWVFYGALSNVEYTVTVTDTATGAVKRYVNPSGTFASVGDTSAFAHGAAPAAARAAGAQAPDRDSVAAAARGAAARTVTPSSCAPSASRLCLQGGRFAVDAAWTDFAGNSGGGTAVTLTGDTGYFWFFGASNVEVMIKVLDGRPLNDKFWVFYGALSSVEYTLTVTDTATGVQRQYHNPSGRFASVGDTAAF